MASSKFSCGEVVWCKSPTSSNVWPAKICTDKNSGQWQQQGKIFLQFYGQVKCQAGKWIAQANVVAFKDINDLGKSPQPSLVAAFKQAQEDFDKFDKESKEGNQGSDNGAALPPTISKPGAKHVLPKPREKAEASSQKLNPGSPVCKGKADTKDTSSRAKENSGNPAAPDASQAAKNGTQNLSTGKPSYGAALMMKREKAQREKLAQKSSSKDEDSPSRPGPKSAKGVPKRSLASIMKDLVPSPEAKRTKVTQHSDGGSSSDSDSGLSCSKKPTPNRGSVPFGSYSNDDSESDIRVSKSSSAADDKNKKDAKALGGKARFKSSEDKENFNPNLMASKKKAVDQTMKVKETEAASLKRIKKQDRKKIEAPEGSGSDGSESDDDSGWATKANKGSSVVKDSDKPDITSLGGKKASFKSREDKDNLKASKKKVNDQAIEVKDNMASSLEKINTQDCNMPRASRGSGSDGSDSDDDSGSDIRVNKSCLTVKDKSKKDAKALGGKKVSFKSGEDKENLSQNLKASRKKANDHATKVKENVATSLEKVKKQGNKPGATTGSSRATASGSGLTVCHQCGQASKDPKSKCRSWVCPSIRGQFCKACLLQHYNQDIDVVLKDPIWQCPPCRGTCTCSTCKTPVGKDSKQILSQLALSRGHQTVRSYFEHLIQNLATESS